MNKNPYIQEAYIITDMRIVAALALEGHSYKLLKLQDNTTHAIYFSEPGLISAMEQFETNQLSVDPHEFIEALDELDDIVVSESYLQDRASRLSE